MELDQEKKSAAYNERLGYNSSTDKADTDNLNKKGTDNSDRKDLDIDIRRGAQKYAIVSAHFICEDHFCRDKFLAIVVMLAKCTKNLYLLKLVALKYV